MFKKSDGLLGRVTNALNSNIKAMLHVGGLQNSVLQAKPKLKIMCRSLILDMNHGICYNNHSIAGNAETFVDHKL